MHYVLTVKGNVKKYPYTLLDLKNDNPSTSFPAEPAPELLAEFGVYPVTLVDKPREGRTKTIKEINPKLVDGKWLQQFVVVDSSADAATKREEEKVRKIRKQFLSDCDWTQLPDSPVDAEAWRTYRQKLRDVTNQKGFPFSVDWPAPPEKARNIED